MAPADPYPPPLPDPYPQPLPPQEPVVEQPQLLLTADEAILLQRGEIDSSLQVYGIVGNALVGFGLGQAIQGRWKETGWKFTAGMGGGLVLLFAATGRDNVGLELGAAAVFITFYVWGIVDAATGPARHNARVRDIKLRHGIPLAPYVATSPDSHTAGLTLRF